MSKDKDRTEKKKKQDLSSYDKDCPCPVCSAPTKMINESMDLIHDGPRINMNGIKLMGGEITKRTQTHYQMYVKGLVCSEGHRFFIQAGSKVRALCPMCHELMIEYGSSLYSCTKCNKHFSKGDWEVPSDADVLRNNGWIEAD